jgi:hypothetical protein
LFYLGEKRERKMSTKQGKNKMLVKYWLLVFAPAAPLILMVYGSHNDKFESPGSVHSFANGSVTIKLPEKWVVEQSKIRANKFEVLSDTRLKVGRDPPDGAMGRFSIEVVVDGRSPVELLAARLDDSGGAPAGGKIEVLEINGRPAARMAAMDELFGEKYLWHTTLIQFEDDVIVYVDFTALGEYENNRIVDRVIETIVVDSAAFRSALEMEGTSPQAYAFRGWKRKILMV